MAFGKTIIFVLNFAGPKCDTLQGILIQLHRAIAVLKKRVYYLSCHVLNLMFHVPNTVYAIVTKLHMTTAIINP